MLFKHRNRESVSAVVKSPWVPMVMREGRNDGTPLVPMVGTPLFAPVLASIAIVLLLVGVILKLLPDSVSTARSSRIVRVYCAAGVVKPAEEIVESFNRSHDFRVEIVRSGGSGELMGQIQTEFETGLVGGADAVISADDQLLIAARANQVVSKIFPIAQQRPVIAVALDKSVAFGSLREMVENREIRFGIASKQAAIGKMVRQIAARDDLLEALESRRMTESENVMTLAQALVAGSLDAAVLWDTTVAQMNPPSLRIACAADAKQQFFGHIAIGIVATTEMSRECQQFAEFLIGAETGEPVFRKNGFSIPPNQNPSP